MEAAAKPLGTACIDPNGGGPGVRLKANPS